MLKPKPDVTRRGAKPEKIFMQRGDEVRINIKRPDESMKPFEWLSKPPTNWCLAQIVPIRTLTLTLTLPPTPTPPSTVLSAFSEAEGSGSNEVTRPGRPYGDKLSIVDLAGSPSRIVG